MKLAEQSSKWYLGVFGGYVACFSLFPLVVRTIPLGTAYATWCSVGMALTTVIGSVVFGEAINVRKVLSIVVIIAGVIGLNLSGGGH